jgi:dihydropteroate synthase
MFTLNCKGKILQVDTPLVMGILNATPDSFFSGSRITRDETLLKTAELMLEAGADIIDIGGQSTRPGAEHISEQDELRRVIPVLSLIHQKFPDAIISIDTFYASVARQAVQSGASLVNDISAGSLDEEMIATVAALDVPYVLMHMRGTPQTMQQFTQYENLELEILDFFIQKLSMVREAGIKDVIIDPGFGFAKTHVQNFEILKNLKSLKVLDCPILAGLSRKGTIQKTLGVTAENALNGTTVLNTIALMNDATILRVHDVREAKEAIRLHLACQGKI